MSWCFKWVVDWRIKSYLGPAEIEFVCLLFISSAKIPERAESISRFSLRKEGEFKILFYLWGLIRSTASEVA